MKKLFENGKFRSFLFLFILGLTPLLWYKPGFLVFGHDMSFPLNPLNFFRMRLYLWTERLGFGSDQSMAVGSFFIHSFEVLAKSLGLSLTATQKVDFVFWFMAPGLAMYYFVSSLGLQKKARSLPLIAAIFYMFNHFLLQGWFMAERTKFSIAAALPLVLVFLIRGIWGKSNLLKTAILVNLVVFFLNGGGGEGSPIYGGLIVGAGVCLIYFTFLDWRRIGIGALKRTFLLTTLVLSLFTVFNFYWILPFSRFVLTDYTQGLASSGGTAGVLQWVRAISKNASFLNLFRLQGIPDWYDNPKHAYANFFLKNPILIFLSFLWPLFAFAAALLAKKKEEKKYVLFFTLLALAGIVFTAGTHPPTGKIYGAFVKYIPFFPIFRTPFYKFGYAIWFAYAFLVSFTVSKLVGKFKNKWLSSAVCFIFIIFILLYNFPFFTGSFFNWNPPLTTMVEVPNYVFDFGEWADSLERDERVLMLPPLNQSSAGYADTYNWNYWSLSTVPSLLTSKPVVGNSAGLDDRQRVLIEGLYSALWKKDEDLAKKLAAILNIKYFLLRKDVFYDLDWSSTTPPGEWQKRLKSFDWVKPEVKFGEWVVFRLETDEFLPRFSSPQFYSFVDKDLETLTPSSFSEFGLREVALSPQDLENSLPLNLADKIYISAQPHPKKRMEITQSSVSMFLPGGKLYFFVRWKEKRAEKKVIESGDLDEVIDFNLGLANKRLGEIEALVKRREEIRKKLGNWEIGKLEEKFAPENAKLRNLEILIEESWERFGERLNKALEVLKEMESQGDDITETALRILEYVKLFQGKFIYFLKDESLQVDVSDKLQSLLIIRRGLEEKAWIDNDELEKRYMIEVPRGGDYELFIKDIEKREIEKLRNSEINKDANNADEKVENTGGEEIEKLGNGEIGPEPERSTVQGEGMFESDPFKPLTFALDGKVATVSGKEREDNWLSFGKYELDEGRHKLQVFLPRFVNLAEQENFTLSAKKGESLILPLEGFLEEGQNFNISFDYKIEGEGLPRLIIAQQLAGEGKDYVWRALDTILPKSEYRLQFIKSFNIDPEAKQVGIKIFFEEYGDSKLYVENFQVTREWRPEVVLRTTAENAEKDAENADEREIGKLGNWEIPKITFQRINSTKYEVWVEGAEEPYLLVFSESYHPEWKVYVSEADEIKKLRNSVASLPEIEGGEIEKLGNYGEIVASYFGGEIKEKEHKDDFVYKGMFDTWGKESIPEDRHLLVNGYANAWYIKPEDVGKSNYRLIVEFWPQRLFYTGLAISGITLMGCFGYLSYGWVKRRNSSRKNFGTEIRKLRNSATE